MSRIRRAARITVLYVIIPAIVFIASAAVFIWKRPVTAGIWLGRLAMARSGFAHVVLQTPSGRLALWEKGQGPVLLILHGANNEGTLQRAIAGPLSAQYRVLVPDLPGHGQSDPQSGPLTFAMMIRAVDAVIDYTREPRITLVGHSMGGWLAIVYAWRHPDRVMRVFSVDGPPIRELTDFMTLSRREFQLPSNREEARRFMAAALNSKNGPPPDFVIDDIVRRSRHGTLPRLMAANPVDFERDLPDDELRKVHTPVDLIWGEIDHDFTVASARKLESLLPAGRLTILPECGHNVPMECSANFLRTFEELMLQPPPTVKNAR